MIAEGWTGNAEWTGWIPFDELPHTYDPPEHFIVSANEKTVPPGYADGIGGEWIEPYRAQRIVDRLRQQSKLTVDDFASIQADTFSLHAKALLADPARARAPDGRRGCAGRLDAAAVES